MLQSLTQLRARYFACVGCQSKFRSFTDFSRHGKATQDRLSPQKLSTFYPPWTKICCRSILIYKKNIPFSVALVRQILSSGCHARFQIGISFLSVGSAFLSIEGYRTWYFPLFNHLGVKKKPQRNLFCVTFYHFKPQLS